MSSKISFRRKTKSFWLTYPLLICRTLWPIYMVYYNKIALIQQIWYVHVFSWSLICSPNVRKKMQEDVSKDISKDISEKTVQNKCQKRCQKICQKNDSRYVRIYMSETMSEDLSTISEDRSGHLSLSIYIYICIYHQNACQVKEMVRRYVRISDKMLSHTVDGRNPAPPWMVETL